MSECRVSAAQWQCRVGVGVGCSGLTIIKVCPGSAPGFGNHPGVDVPEVDTHCPISRDSRGAVYAVVASI